MSQTISLARLQSLQESPKISSWADVSRISDALAKNAPHPISNTRAISSIRSLAQIVIFSKQITKKCKLLKKIREIKLKSLMQKDEIVKKNDRIFSITYLDFVNDKKLIREILATWKNELNHEIIPPIQEEMKPDEMIISLSTDEISHVFRSNATIVLMMNELSYPKDIIVIIAKDQQQQVQAMAFCKKAGKKIYLKFIATAPHNLPLKCNETNRVQGAGTSIIQFLVRVGLIYNYEEIELESYSEINGFYQSLGFKLENKVHSLSLEEVKHILSESISKNL